MRKQGRTPPRGFGEAEALTKAFPAATIWDDLDRLLSPSIRIELLRRIRQLILDQFPDYDSGEGLPGGMIFSVHFLPRCNRLHFKFAMECSPHVVGSYFVERPLTTWLNAMRAVIAQRRAEMIKAALKKR